MEYKDLLKMVYLSDNIHSMSDVLCKLMKALELTFTIEERASVVNAIEVVREDIIKKHEEYGNYLDKLKGLQF